MAAGLFYFDFPLAFPCVALLLRCARARADAQLNNRRFHEKKKFAYANSEKNEMPPVSIAQPLRRQRRTCTRRYRVRVRALGLQARRARVRHSFACDSSAVALFGNGRRSACRRRRVSNARVEARTHASCVSFRRRTFPRCVAAELRAARRRRRRAVS